MRKMIEVPATEANNYSRILTLIGMEEEGDPVAEIEQLRADAERLDFLEKHPTMRGRKDLRSAIDAAMNKGASHDR